MSKPTEDAPQAYSVRLLEKATERELLRAFPVRPSKNAHKTTPRGLLQILLAATATHAFITGTLDAHATQKRAPDTDTVFYHLGKATPQDALQWFDTVHAWLLAQAKARCAFRTPAWVAIDEHRIPYYGKDTSLTTEGEKKRGTRKAFSLVSVEAVRQGERFALALHPRARFKDPQELAVSVLTQAQRRAPVAGALLDKGFYAVRVVQALQRLQVPFLVAATKSTRVTEAIRQHRAHATRIPATRPHGSESLAVLPQHEMEGKGGRARVTLALLYRIDREGKETVHAWVTDPGLGFDETLERVRRYSSRWGIETGYRCKVEARAKTVSRKSGVRVLLMVASFLLYNAWTLVAWSRRPRNVPVGARAVRYLTFRTGFLAQFDGWSELFATPGLLA